MLIVRFVDHTGAVLVQPFKELKRTPTGACEINHHTVTQQAYDHILGCLDQGAHAIRMFGRPPLADHELYYVGPDVPGAPPHSN